MIAEQDYSYHSMPPEFSNVPYQIRPLPQWGTRPTRAVVSVIVNITQLPVWVVRSLYWCATILVKGMMLLWGWVCAALRMMVRWFVDGAVSSVKKAVGGAANAVAGVQEVAERVYADVPVQGVEVEAEELVIGMGMGGMRDADIGEMMDMEDIGDWMQAGTGDAWEVPGMGSDQVIF